MIRAVRPASVKFVVSDQLRQMLVDMCPVLTDLVETGSRDQAPMRPRKLLADRVVIGVEQETIIRIEDAVTRQFASTRTARKTTSCARDATASG